VIIVARLLAVPMARIVIALVLWGIALTTRQWLKPMYAAMANQHSFMGKVLKGTGIGYLVKGIDWATHKTAHAISHHAVANVAPLTHYQQGIASRTRHVNDAQARFAEAAAASMYHLRHRTMPHAIRVQVHPVAIAASRAGTLAGRSISLGQKERRERLRSIDRLAKEVGTLALGFLGIDYLVKRHHARAHHHDHVSTLPKTAAQVGRTRAQVKAQGRRISRLERLLRAGAIAAAVTAVLVRAIPSWRCSNFRNVRRLLRCSHWRWLEALLFLAVDALTLRDICLLVGYIERGAVAFQPYVHELIVTGENWICGDMNHMPSAIVGSDRDSTAGFASGVVGADFAL
jgi:hypothetical protein